MHKFRPCTWLLVPALILGAAPLHGQVRKQRPLAPNPSAFVAADIGFSRMAQDKGTAAAVREYGEAQAQFVPPDAGTPPVPARDWGKNAPSSFRLTPQAVVISCDGNMAVTQGRWDSGQASGPYMSLWTRDDKGRLKWRVHQRGAGMDAEQPRAAGGAATMDRAPMDEDEDVGFVRSQQAVCHPKAPKAADASGASGVDVTIAHNWSADHSLSWRMESVADGQYGLRVALWDGKTMATVFAPTAMLVQK